VLATPCQPVTIIAAYADPGRVLAATMIPALDQGWTPLAKLAAGFAPGVIPPPGE
jgi:hypothetical protein